MLQRILKGLGIAAIGVAAEVAAAPTGHSIDVSQSRVEITFSHDHRVQTAPLRMFSGYIDYDESHPSEAHAVLELQPASVDLGCKASKADLPEPQWQDTEDLPAARFSSTSVVPYPAGQLDAIGTLTIKGRSRKVRVPLFAGPAIGGQIFDGSFEISRSEFGIGLGRSDVPVDDHVRVRFHLFEPTGV